jgi:hypothetical protein
MTGIRYRLRLARSLSISRSSILWSRKRRWIGRIKIPLPLCRRAHSICSRLDLGPPLDDVGSRLVCQPEESKVVQVRPGSGLSAKTLLGRAVTDAFDRRGAWTLLGETDGP